MSTAEKYPQKHSPRWLLNKIQTSKHDGESLMAILEFQKVISNDAIISRVNAISDVEILLTSSEEEHYVNDQRRIGFQKGIKWFKNKILKQ